MTRNTSPGDRRSGQDRRKSTRIPLSGLVEPINLRFTEGDDAQGTAVPAVITNLSEDGMSMVTFTEPPHAKEFDLELNLPGLHHMPITAKVLWVKTKGATYAVGMTFVKITKKDKATLKKMSEDFQDCTTRKSLGLPDACGADCPFHSLWGKQKA